MTPDCGAGCLGGDLRVVHHRGSNCAQHVHVASSRFDDIGLMVLLAHGRYQTQDAIQAAWQQFDEFVRNLYFNLAMSIGPLWR